MKFVPKILIIDDDSDILESLTLVLESIGYRITTATDGLQGLEKLKDKDDLPDLILLDLMMPGMNGWEFREAQLKNQDLAKIPVVLLSGVAMLGKEAASLQIADYLPKTAGIKKICAIIDRLCGLEEPLDNSL